MGKDMSGDNEQPFCLNPECWEGKQEEAQQEALRADSEKNLVDISKFSYTQYEYWNKGADSYDQSECRNCEYKKKAKGRGDQYFCFEPACMKKKKTAKTKADNKKKNDAFQVELQDIAEMAKGKVDALFYKSRDEGLVMDRPAIIYLTAQILANVGEWHNRKITLFKYLKEKLSWDNDVLKLSSWQLLNSEWEVFLRLLETLSERQLLELIFEWPAVARGLKGVAEWFLQQVPQPSEPVNKLPEESEFDTMSVITGRVKRCKDCTHINENRICSAFGFERISLTSPQHCPHYELRGDVDIELIPKSAEEFNRQDEPMFEPGPQQEQGSDPVHELMGRRIKTNYGSGGVVTNVTGPSDDGTYTVKCKGLTDRELSIINHVSLKDAPVLRYGFDGKPEVFLESDEPGNMDLPATRYLDKNGHVIFVSTGLGGSEFGTFWETAGGFSKHRVKTPAMPMTPSREEAQRNLDAWAEKNGLQPVDGGDSECKSA